MQLNYNKNMINFLGDFSMIMYFARPIAQKIGIVYLRGSSNSVLIYILLSFVFSVILYCLDKVIRKNRKRRNEERMAG